MNKSKKMYEGLGGKDVEVYSEGHTFKGKLTLQEDYIILDDAINLTEFIEGLYHIQNTLNPIQKLCTFFYPKELKRVDNPSSKLRKGNQIRLSLEKITGIKHTP